MLTLPDFKEKKIIFLLSWEDNISNLNLSNSNLRLKKDGKFVDQISCHLISVVFIVGHCTITSKLIAKLKDYGISVFFLNESLRCYASIMSEAEGNYKLRMKQYELSQDCMVELSKNLIKNKIKNQYKISKSVNNPVRKKVLTQSLDKLYHAKSLDSILGIEGSFARAYFSAVFESIGWYRRAPQTKEDILNLLLDIGYTFLFNYVESLLRLFGFDTYKGYFHQLFFERKSLACDLMEPMRPLIDKQLIKSFNLNQIDEDDFKFENGAFRLKSYKLSKKYTKIWFEIIMKNRVEIYKYVLSHYRFMMDSDKYELPYFSSNIR